MPLRPRLRPQAWDLNLFERTVDYQTVVRLGRKLGISGISGASRPPGLIPIKDVPAYLFNSGPGISW
jgi:hypothetical protein